MEPKRRFLKVARSILRCRGLTFLCVLNLALTASVPDARADLDRDKFFDPEVEGEEINPPELRMALPVVGEEVAPAEKPTGWFPSPQATMNDLFTLFEEGRERAFAQWQGFEQDARKRGVENWKQEGWNLFLEEMNSERAVYEFADLGRVKFTNIDGSPVAEIDYDLARTRFLFIDAQMVDKKSAHLRKYAARQHIEKKRNVVLIWLRDGAASEVDVRWRPEVDSIRGAMARFREYFYTFYERPTRENVAFGVVCGIINAGIIGVGVSALKVAFDPSADFLWTPVVVGGMWSTILGIYSKTYRGWVYNTVSRYKETGKSLVNTVLFNYTMVFASSLESGAPSGITIEDPSATMLRDSVAASPTQGASNLEALSKATFAAIWHNWSKVEANQWVRVLHMARQDQGQIRIFKNPFTGREYKVDRREVNYQIWANMGIQIPRLMDLVGVSLAGVPIGTLFFYSYGFVAKGVTQLWARHKYPRAEKALGLTEKWRPLAAPFYFLGRGPWDYIRALFVDDRDRETETEVNEGFWRRMREKLGSVEAQRRFDERVAEVKRYYYDSPIRLVKISQEKMVNFARGIQHYWLERRTGQVHEDVLAKRLRNQEEREFLTEMATGSIPRRGHSCSIVFSY